MKIYKLIHTWLSLTSMNLETFQLPNIKTEAKKRFVLGFKDYSE